MLALFPSSHLRAMKISLVTQAAYWNHVSKYNDKSIEWLKENISVRIVWSPALLSHKPSYCTVSEETHSWQAQILLAWFMSTSNTEEDDPSLRDILSYMIQTGKQYIYCIPENGKTGVMKKSYIFPLSQIQLFKVKINIKFS